MSVYLRSNYLPSDRLLLSRRLIPPPSILRFRIRVLFTIARHFFSIIEMRIT